MSSSASKLIEFMIVIGKLKVRPYGKYYLTFVCMYVCSVVITTFLVLPGVIGRAFHPSLYRANKFAPYYTAYSVGTGTNQKDKHLLGSFHGDIHSTMTL